MGMLFGHARTDEGAEQAATGCPDAGASERRHQPARGDHRPNARDRQHAEAGEQPGAAAQERASRGSGCRAGACWMISYWPCRRVGWAGDRLCLSRTVRDEADISLRDAGRLECCHGLQGVVVIVVEMGERALGHVGLLWKCGACQGCSGGYCWPTLPL
jgi:hypothetical protein